MGTMEQAKKYIIYKATNKINGKIYIGQTIFSLKRRASGHRNSAFNRFSNLKFHKALRKYGFDSFFFEEIDKAVGFKEACDKEKYYIYFYDSYKNGYNSDLGGNTRPISKNERECISKKLKGHYVSEETKQKIRDARKKQYIPKWTEERRKRHSEILKSFYKNHDSSLKGSKFSKDHCKKISEALKGRHLTEEHKKRISEIQTGKVVPNSTREKISKSLKCRIITEEHKRKISETRKKLGLGNYGRWKKEQEGGSKCWTLKK